MLAVKFQFLVNSSPVIEQTEFFRHLYHEVFMSDSGTLHNRSYRILQLFLKRHLPVKRYLGIQRCKELVLFLKIGNQYMLVITIYLPQNFQPRRLNTTSPVSVIAMHRRSKGFYIFGSSLIQQQQQTHTLHV